MTKPQLIPSIETAAAIRFDDGRAVEFTKAFAYADECLAAGDVVWPSEVVWADGSYSYAKGWIDSQSARLVQVGAGAYGLMTLLQREV